MLVPTQIVPSVELVAKQAGRAEAKHEHHLDTLHQPLVTTQQVSQAASLEG